jgi:thiamine-monophosphate kinase
MFQNANHTSLSEFTKEDLLVRLNSNTDQLIDINHIANNGAELVIDHLQWNNTAHFDLTYTPWKHLGFKMVVAGLSKMLVKGIRPDLVLLSITTSSIYSLDALEELVSGVGAACDQYKCAYKIIDVTTTASGLYFNITTISSSLPARTPWINSELNAGDLICVTGDLGAAYLGLMLLEREKRIFKENPEMQPDLEEKAYIVGRQLKPDLRQDILEMVVGEKLELSAASLISDGLAQSIKTVLGTSGLGAMLYEDKLPIDTQTLMQGIDFGIDPTVAALNGGEDYEWCLVMPQSSYDLIEANKHNISIVGYIADQTQDILITLKSGRTENVTSLNLTNPE